MYPPRGIRLYNILSDMKSIMWKSVRLPSVKPHILALLYHKGRILRNLSVNCFQCDEQKKDIKEIRNENYDFEIMLRNVFSSMHIITEVVEDPRRTHASKGQFPSMNFNLDDIPVTEYYNLYEKDSGYEYNKIECPRFWERSKSWISSNIYHINCSQPVEDISLLSDLNQETIQEICTFENIE